ncbi:phosphodiester glycosidase family protein [Filobacillus milosensis]|uniref:Phosphodiester glycosidase family protein n=1 Tax=Filobacillus milosensis TaxID=94137 RepID=A0A4Y8IRW2_9BACI|nr:phosphodiester glycosidase family protein [Filobacillus milosensis]TFB24467.1 phosphodiester glycosidase family protein [Filobacillus milosensis]
MRKQFFRGLSVFIVLVLVGNVLAIGSLAETKSYEVTPGVEYELDESQDSQSIRMMELDLSQSHLDLDLGMNDNYPSVDQLSDLAREISEPGYRVVGGVNASFFYTDFERPTYLISKDGKLLNLGTVASSSGYMQTPSAFGMSNDGEGLIGTFDLDIEFNANGKTITVDKYNSERGAGESVLYSPSNYHYTPGTNKWGVEIYVHKVSKNIEGNEMELGEVITGQVKEIRPYMTDPARNIPSDGYVISVHGNSDIAEGLEIGDTVDLKLDTNNQWKDTQYVIGTGPVLLQGGEVASDMIPSNYVARAQAPRTAIGVNQDGSKVYLITVDGRQSGYSDGMSLIDFAQYLKSKGIYQAINLDGGGSTTMVAREYGDVYPSLMNRPSSGYERSVINGLFAVVNKESGIPHKIGVERDEEGKVVIGTGFSFDVNYVLDEYYHPVDYVDSDLSFKVEGNIGRLEGQSFIAEEAGSGSIVVSMDQAEKVIPIEVIQAPDEVKLSPDAVQVGYDRNLTFDLDAQMADGSPVIWDPGLAEWSVTNNIGTVNDQGEFTSASLSQDGEVVVSINGITYTSDVIVGGDDRTVDSLEGDLNWFAGSEQVELTQSSEQAAIGQQSLQLDYNFGDGDTFKVEYNGDEIKDQPEHIGMWVRGDLRDHQLGIQVTSEDSQTHQIPFTQQNSQQWSGWQYVKAELPKSLTSPFTIDHIFMDKGAKGSVGSVNMDEVVLSFNNQIQSFNQLENYDVVPQSKKWKVTFDRSIDPESVHEDSIFIENVDGEKQDVSFEFNDKNTVITITANNYQVGNFYQLVINEQVRGQNGFNKLGKTYKLFKVE